MTKDFDSTFGGKVLRLIVGRSKKQPHHGDPSREVFETVVFVVTLVLMLKLFVAEAFVIPTGSMATTLWGDQVRVKCPDCGHAYAVTGAEAQGVRKAPSVSVCQNCGRLHEPSNSTDYHSGDRVLVAKYDYHVRAPKRFDVPVFKFPENPYHRRELQAMNYIKRLVGLPGETIAIYKGDLYRTTSLNYEGRERPIDPKTGNERKEDLWQINYTYPNDPEAVAAFGAGKFEIIRKTPSEMLTVRRLVFDFDQQPASLALVNKARWHPGPEDGAGWTVSANALDHAGSDYSWVRYQHVQPGWRSGAVPRQPVPISDLLAYNVYDLASSNGPAYWVPDLMVECEVNVRNATDRVALELAKSGDRHVAEFTEGECRLLYYPSSKPNGPVVLGAAKTSIATGSSHEVRFANFDARLTVWVDGKVLEFGPPADLASPSRDRTTFRPSTLDINQPARIGAMGEVKVSKVKLYRDVYYTCNSFADAETPGYVDCDVQTYYVQPGHYFCLGDNSASSLDGRSWGLVPERLMLGKAVWIYLPLSRFGKIR